MPVNTCPWKRTCSHGVTGCREVSKISMIVYLKLSSLLSSPWDPQGCTHECQELWSSPEKDLRWWYSWEVEKQKGSQTTSGSLSMGPGPEHTYQHVMGAPCSSCAEPLRGDSGPSSRGPGQGQGPPLDRGLDMILLLNLHFCGFASLPAPYPTFLPASPSLVLLSQGEEHSLGCVLEEGSPVLLLSLLHPVAIDSESIGIDESAQRPEGVGVTDDDLPGHRLHPAVLVVDPHRSQHR